MTKVEGAEKNGLHNQVVLAFITNDQNVWRTVYVDLDEYS